MPVRIGIVGLGFMGNAHWSHYDSIPGAKVVAVCDTDRRKLRPGAKAAAGNIAAGGAERDFSAVRTYTDVAELLRDDEVDVVDITLPTYLHHANAVKALKAGKDVICEKPLAITARDAKRIVDAAKSTGRRLFVAQCIRYWPAYAKLKEFIDRRTYGKVQSAVFRRVSLTPTWSWENWLMDRKKSGAVVLDMHIHDTDFVYHAFGKPRAVTSHGTSCDLSPQFPKKEQAGKGRSPKRIDHIFTNYEYPGNLLVVTEGAWEYSSGFGFEMSFNVSFEKAAVVMTPDLKLHVHPMRGTSKTVRLSPKDGYRLELEDFVDAIRKDRAAKLVTPESALNTVRIVEAEVQSVLKGKTVPVKF